MMILWKTQFILLQKDNPINFVHIEITFLYDFKVEKFNHSVCIKIEFVLGLTILIQHDKSDSKM